ncbi:TonB-dependent receptor plug domain protein [Operophtera brumata]|uniref:TonB-dependent receptor plug domain protein n=1 Tax=Operophtera brumata TaxID=104452 RepID=A0A0L7LA91_OPEBR|nr:TonB-dependent receptor plug domain protein [Operophtera brumata]
MLVVLVLCKSYISSSPRPEPRYLLNMSKVLNGLKYTLIFVGLIVIDYILGNGLVEICLKLLCKITCFVKKTIRKEAVLAKMTGNENTISMPTLFLEILMLWGTIVDRIDDLLQESNETLRQTNDGDAGDTISFTDTTLLSMTSILDYDGVEPIDDLPSEEAMVERSIDYNCRQLWDVIEEEDSGSVNI